MALLDVYGLVLLRTFSHKNCKKCLLLVNKPHTPHWRRSPPMRGWLSSRRQRNWWLWQRFFSSAWLCRLAPVWFKNLAKHLNVQESVNKPITKYHEVNPPVVLFLIFSVFSHSNALKMRDFPAPSRLILGLCYLQYRRCKARRRRIGEDLSLSHSWRSSLAGDVYSSY